MPVAMILPKAGIAEQMDIEARLPHLGEHHCRLCRTRKRARRLYRSPAGEKTRDAAAVARLACRTASMGTGKTVGGNGSDLNRIARDARKKGGNAFDRVMGRQNSVHSSTDAAQLAKLKELEDFKPQQPHCRKIGGIESREIR